MSVATDPLTFALGAFGLICALAAVEFAAWVALCWACAWRRRRRLARMERQAVLRLAPRSLAERLELDVDVAWRWPQRP